MSFIMLLTIMVNLYLTSSHSSACEDINSLTNNYFCRINDTEACNSLHEACNNWCKGIQWINWTVINADLGHIKFTLSPAPLSCCHVRYEIALKLAEVERCSPEKYGCLHSTSLVTKEDCSNISCSNCELIEFEVKYIFSSRYYLDIKAFTVYTMFSPSYCSSDVVHILTNYNKTLIGNGTLTINPPVFKKSELYLSLLGKGGGNDLQSAEILCLTLMPCGLGQVKDRCRDEVSIFQKTNKENENYFTYDHHNGTQRTVYPPNDLLYTAINFGIPHRFWSYPNTVLVRLNSGIDMSSEDCSNTGIREACCFTGEHINDCCKRGYLKPSNCSCKWVNESLMCYFSNINPGSYCLHVELSDLRCDHHSLWATENDCTWHHSFNILPPANLSYTPAVYSFEGHSVLWTVLSIFLIVISLVSIVVVCVYFKPYPKRIYHRYVTCAPIGNYQLSTLEKPQILLLYPRDREAFMSAMRSFRSLLQEFLHCQVYDMWDDDNWDSVNEIGPQWAIRFITDKSVKVIVVASPCSLKFEEALITCKSIKYRGCPDCRDSVFFYSFKESVSTANRSTDNYNRFFVVRLDEPDCEENKFTTITPCRTYTIPQHVKDLTLQIHNLDPGGVILNPHESSKISNLKMSISELKNFKLNNPNYLTELIELVKEDNSWNAQ